MIRTLVTVLVLLVLGIAGLVAYQLLNDHDDAGQQPSRVQPSTPGPSHDLGTPLPEPKGEPTNNPQQVARKFAQAFTTTNGGKQAWLNRLQPLVSDAMYRGFENTNLRQVPPGHPKDMTPLHKSEIQGRPTASTTVTYTSGLILQLRLTIDQATNRWVITRNAPVRMP